MAETGTKCSVEGCGAYATKSSNYRFCYQHDTDEKVVKQRALARIAGGSVRKMEATLTSDAIKEHPILNRSDLLWLLNMLLVDVCKLFNSTAKSRAITDIARTLDNIVVREEEVQSLKEEINSLKRQMGIDVEVEAEEV